MDTAVIELDGEFVVVELTLLEPDGEIVVVDTAVMELDGETVVVDTAVDEVEELGVRVILEECDAVGLEE